MTIEAPTILALRRDPRLLKLPPYLSALCIFIGLVWLCLLPLNEYSRHTYISENALLPGQVHTYFGGSEQNIFKAYKYEVQALVRKDREAYVCWNTAGLHFSNGRLRSGSTNASVTFSCRPV